MKKGKKGKLKKKEIEFDVSKKFDFFKKSGLLIEINVFLFI